MRKKVIPLDTNDEFHSGKETKTEKNSEVAFNRALFRLMNDVNALKMKQFGQHHGNNTYQHCVNVAKCSFYLAQKLHWNINEEELATGAMLHDYYLYCTKDMTMSSFKHGVSHPETALENAEKIWNLDKKEENIIRSHMFPLTLVHIPSCKEAWLVSMADKYCAAREFTATADEKSIQPGDGTRWITNYIRHVREQKSVVVS
jgi:uncharacterized protein